MMCAWSSLIDTVSAWAGANPVNPASRTAKSHTRKCCLQPTKDIALSRTGRTTGSPRMAASQVDGKLVNEVQRTRSDEEKSALEGIHHLGAEAFRKGGVINDIGVGKDIRGHIKSSEQKVPNGERACKIHGAAAIRRGVMPEAKDRPCTDDFTPPRGL